MASYFTLELDTTPPLVEIFAPTYTVRGINNDVEVVANEELSLFQEIYIIDSLGVRHDLIFSHNGDRFVGVVNFEGYPVGSASLYATVKDTLLNQSYLVYEIIDIISDLDAMRMTVDIEDVARNIVIEDITREITTYDGSEIQITVSDSDIAT